MTADLQFQHIAYRSKLSSIKTGLLQRSSYSSGRFSK